jgi:hypothetical protein
MTFRISVLRSVSLCWENKAERADPYPEAFTSLPIPESGTGGTAPTPITAFPPIQAFLGANYQVQAAQGLHLLSRSRHRRDWCQGRHRQMRGSLEAPTPPLAPLPGPLPNLQLPGASELGAELIPAQALPN